MKLVEEQVAEITKPVDKAARVWNAVSCSLRYFVQVAALGTCHSGMREIAMLEWRQRGQIFRQERMLDNCTRLVDAISRIVLNGFDVEGNTALGVSSAHEQNSAGVVE